MIEKIKQFFSVEIKKEYKAHFSAKMINSNNIRSQVVLYAIGLIMVIWLIPAIYLQKPVIADTIFLLIVALCIVFLNFFKDKKYVNYFQLFIMSICLLWAQYSNFQTYGGTDNFTPYLVGVLAFATIPYIRPLQSALILGINHIVFLLVSFNLIGDVNVFVDFFGNSSLFLIFAWTISVFHYNTLVSSFINDQLVKELNGANQKLEDYMRIDIGTGICNRLAFEETLKFEWKRSKRFACALSMAMIDIDFFKQYNDTYGHSKGDVCLREVAQCINGKMSRSSDFTGRYGGEEFVLIMPQADIDTAFIHAERIRSAIEELQIKHESRPDEISCVSISVGVATIYPKKDDMSNILIESADDALYKAKRNGRNRVERA